MSGTNARLKLAEAQDYQQLLDAISEIVIEFVRAGHEAGVREWAASLAHVGNVLLDDRKNRDRAVA